MAALALALVALARPQKGTEEEDILTEGVDIVIALDASGSMAAEDYAPRNRLAVAKLVIGQFIEGLKHDRVGLVVSMLIKQTLRYALRIFRRAQLLHVKRSVLSIKIKQKQFNANTYFITGNSI